MKSSVKKNMAFIAIIAVTLVLCGALLCLTVALPASAADSFVESDEISVGHITDTHYYPFRLIYTGTDKSAQDNEDYCYNWVMEKSTKLWLESATAFDASLMRLGGVTMDSSKIPDYLVLSGDCGQDGELLAHIDVANKFRLLQNYIRANYKPNFQIFVVMGNHDLYNPETYRFDNATGLKTPFMYTSRMEAVKIYAGLGYPNMTDEEAAAFYGPLANDTETVKYDGTNNLYDYSAIAENLRNSELPYYVRSNLSDDFLYTWQFLQEVKDSETGEVTYGTIIDPSEVAADDLTMDKFLEQGRVITINNNAATDGTKFYSKQKLKDATDLEMGYMSGIAARKDGKFTAVMIDVILSNAVEGHVLGGRLQPETMDLMNANTELAHGDKNTLIIGTAHHSVNPHWDMEEEITTGFILYNPIEASDFLADYGMRYVYTGHQHANDSTARISSNGNIIYDMESAANVSAGSQIKITRIARGTVGGVYAEKATLEEWENNELSTDRNMVPTSYELYDKVFKNDPYGYVKKNNIGEFVDKNDGHILNYSRLTQRRVYDNALLNVIDNFFQKDITNKLGSMLGGIKIGPISLESFGKEVVTIANNLISEVNDKILSDYTYGGETERFRANDMKIFGYLEELINRVAYYSLVPGDENANVFTVVMECYMRHNLGENWETTEQMPENYRKVLEKVRSGEFVRILVDELLSYDTGLMKIIKGLTETTLNLSKGVDPGFASLLNGFIKTYAPGTTLANFNLGELLASDGISSLISGLVTDNFGLTIDLKNHSVTEVLDDLVDKYITDNFIVSLGEYAYNIGVAFGVNNNVNRLDVQGNGKEFLLTVKERSADYSYIAKTYSEEVSVENGKLPSMITTNFGSDPKTSENFTYFTDRRITDGAIEYTTDITDAHANAKRVKADTKIYGTTKGLIDLGIWCQAGYLELARHTVSLTGLTPGTTYAYRLGSPSENYWSEWFRFTTATDDGFDVLISSDLQSSTETSYQRIDSIYHDVIDKEFADGVDFLLNPGDFVDNGRNLTQFRWAINSSRDIYASIPMVITAGNHDEKYFDIEKAKNAKEYGITPGAVTGEYNYLWSHFNYELTAEQTMSEGFYYSFDYADVHFVVLNTNDIVKTDAGVSQLGEVQYDWLVSDLEKSTKTYKVVLMHKSLYSEGSHSYDPDVVGMRAQLTPLFAEKGVNLVIAGHDHVYNESFYLDKDGKKVNTDANGKNEIAVGSGTLYVTMGTMGEKFYNFVDNPDVPTNVGANLHKDGRLSDPTFGKLEFKDGKLSYYGYQYIRQLSEDKKAVLGGEVNSIERNAMTITVIIAIALTAVMGISAILAFILNIVKARKNRKNA